MHNGRAGWHESLAAGALPYVSVLYAWLSLQMALKGSSSEALARTKTEYESFLGDAAKLKEVRERMKVGYPSGALAPAHRASSTLRRAYLQYIWLGSAVWTATTYLQCTSSRLGETETRLSGFVGMHPWVLARRTQPLSGVAVQ